jgi:Domain of unknown function (DUF5666)
MKTYSRLILLAASLVLTSCGGGGSGGGVPDSGGIGGTGVSIGVMTKGSVIVNGVHYDDSGAQVSIDDTSKAAVNLQSGMVVTVRGTIDGTGRNGTAEQVVAQSEVRGLVTAVFALETPQRFVVLGQNVLIDDQTILSNLARPIANNLVGALVEVHGLRDSTSAQNIRATRVELNQSLMGSPLVDELRGVVSGRANATDMFFNVGTQPVNATGVPNVAGSFGDGSIVEVHCTARTFCINNANEFIASSIEVEDVSNRPANGRRFEVEGLVSGLTPPNPNLPPAALSFSVAGVSVTTSASTRYEGGIYYDMTNNIKVEAEGTWNEGSRILVASKIEFKRSVVRLQGIVTALGSGTFTLNIAGNPVNVETDRFTAGNIPTTIGSLPITSSNCVQVRGQRKAGGVLVVTAGEIRVSNCGNSSRPVIQAPVEAKNPETLVTLLGVSIDVSDPTDTPEFENTADVGITRTEFFNAVVAASSSVGSPPVAGTLVKIIFNENANTVRQVELED